MNEDFVISKGYVLCDLKRQISEGIADSAFGELYMHFCRMRRTTAEHDFVQRLSVRGRQKSPNNQ